MNRERWIDKGDRMHTLDSLKRKIKTADGLQSVVKTMKTLAAVSIRQYELAVASLAQYDRAIAMGFRMLLWNHPFHVEVPFSDQGKGLGAIVFGSDQGMCGQFNEQVCTHAINGLTARSTDQEKWSVLAVGIRAVARLEEAGLAVDATFEVPGSVTAITPMVQELISTIERWRNERELGQILVFYSVRSSAASSRPTTTKLLPFTPEKLARLNRKNWPSRALPMLTMDPNRLFSALTRQYLFVSLFRACAESLASENASRIASMQAAERNIEDRLHDLQMQYHQLRQSSITSELLDVVTGFEALNKEPRV